MAMERRRAFVCCVFGGYRWCNFNFELFLVNFGRFFFVLCYFWNVKLE